ncbi:copper chaperone [Sandaracinomonas limnophila]|uniref:Copper chaperone n=1 Tax=Sandaracinomonas limnophila TaxID=1862386 RepID=A0A437PMA9_9BACT|nr:heavy-metal-associated domain-containing protein [Sandaracinomonas limnophila]RVU23426.1 copper chaperone [Sandaracinomonas limnophila]
MKYSAELQNIKCGGCISSVKDNLSKLAGVATVEVDLTSKILSLEGEDFDILEIESKLKEIGYPVI